MKRPIGKIALGVLGALAMLGVGSAAIHAQGFGRGYQHDPYRPVVPATPYYDLDRGYYPPSPPGYSSYRPGFDHRYGPSPFGPQGRMLLGMSGQLVAEVDAFVVAFTRDAHIVPQGRQMLTDARRLRDAAFEFDLAARQGVDPRRLSSLARDIDRHASRLVNRVDRVARGRLGPNIAHVYRIGALAEDLQRAVRGA